MLQTRTKSITLYWPIEHTFQPLLLPLYKDLSSGKHHIATLFLYCHCQRQAPYCYPHLASFPRVKYITTTSSTGAMTKGKHPTATLIWPALSGKHHVATSFRGFT
ncbi:hypothetical protein DSO57_1014057 [Entomophthora muscae]|uniref:Uncharacterized protein n=1 Tax=Entomophthora muscae TaxID=34485 RepID=A0ACC2SUP9_9FUNG|nr:hypothetical protein DSO57_1014057 [Entomophthora muscae]